MASIPAKNKVDYSLLLWENVCDMLKNENRLQKRLYTILHLFGVYVYGGLCIFIHMHVKRKK
jgi:hypothetical protein